MSPESKQRVVGIVVLIAFIVLLIPFLFSSDIKKKEQAVTTNNDSVPVQVVENADGKSLSENLQPQAAAPVPPVEPSKDQTANQLLPPSSEQPAGAAVTTNSIDPPPIPPAAEPKPATAEEGLKVAEQAKIEGPVKAEEKIKVEESVTTPAPIAAKETIKPKAKAKPKIKAKVKAKTKTKPAATDSSSGSWSVQIGSYSNQTQMQKVIDKLQSNGYQVYLQKITTSRGEMVRVLVGRESSKLKATKVAERLKTKLKINGHVVGNKK